MLRVCSRFVNPEDAKELAGDAIAWLWEHRQDLRIETSLSSYLLKSVQNRALNLRQQQERKAHADTRYYEKMEEMIRDSVDELHYRELSALVKRAIDDLPSEYRGVFVRHRFGGRKYKEIAGYLKGKTAQDIEQIPDDGTDADLASLCTIDITDLQKAALRALDSLRE